MKKHTYNIIVLAMFVILMTSCGIYSFTGTSIQPDVKTVNIEYFEYKALKVNPTLANDLTEAMKDKFRKLTKLEQVDGDADLTIAGEITGYDVKATSVSANEQAAMNRLTVNVKIYFTNKKYPEDDFEKSFSAYADFSADQMLDAVEGDLISGSDGILDKLCEDIFNATVANW